MLINAYLTPAGRSVTFQALFSLLGASSCLPAAANNLLCGGSFVTRVMAAAVLWILGNGTILNTQS
jgi:hypothetical protein